MSFFSNLFKKDIIEEPLLSSKDIQGNINDEENNSPLLSKQIKEKRRKNVAEIIKILDTCYRPAQEGYAISNVTCNLVKYIKEDPTIFLEKINDIIPEKALFNTEIIKNYDLLQYIISFKSICRQYATTDLMDLIKSIAQRLFELNISLKIPYLIWLYAQKYNDTFIKEMIEYFDINGADYHGNILFYIKKTDYKFLGFLCDCYHNKINFNYKNKKGNTFIHQYIIDEKTDLMKPGLVEFLYGKIFDFNAINDEGFNMLSLAINKLSWDFAITISDKNYVDSDSIKHVNWVRELMISEMNYNHKKAILRNLNKSNKLEPNLFIKLFDEVSHKNHKKLFEIMTIIEIFILHEQNYRVFLDYSDEDGNTIIHKLSQIRHKEGLKFIIDRVSDIKFSKNKKGEYPADVYKNNKLYTLLSNNNI